MGATDSHRYRRRWYCSGRKSGARRRRRRPRTHCGSHRHQHVLHTADRELGRRSRRGERARLGQNRSVELPVMNQSRHGSQRWPAEANCFQGVECRAREPLPHFRRNVEPTRYPGIPLHRLARPGSRRRSSGRHATPRPAPPSTAMIVPVI